MLRSLALLLLGIPACSGSAPTRAASVEPASPVAMVRRPVHLEVGYCIDVDGSASEAAIRVSSGDPKLDAVCVAAVEAWRFEPTQQDGHPVRTCTSRTFDFRL